MFSAAPAPCVSFLDCDNPPENQCVSKFYGSNISTYSIFHHPISRPIEIINSLNLDIMAT